MKKRFVSIDIFRGFAIIYMIFSHMATWGHKIGISFIFDIIVYLIDGLGAEGFMFISGLSLTLSYQNNMNKIKNVNEYKQYRLEFFIRAILIFVVGFFQYNLLVSISFGFQYLWVWYIFQTLSISMILIWPLLKCKKIIKILFGVIFLILHQILFETLNKNGVIFYIFYNGFLASPLLGFFPFFIFGSILADLIYEKVNNEEAKISNKEFIKTFTIPTILIGALVLIVLFVFFPSQVLKANELAWLLYSSALQLVLFPIFFTIEKLDLIKLKREYKFFFYFSYYSLSVFVIHTLLFSIFSILFGYEFFLFKYIILYFVIIFLFYLFLRYIYNKFGRKFALKYHISRLASSITLSILEKFYNKEQMMEKKINKDNN